MCNGPSWWPRLTARSGEIAGVEARLARGLEDGSSVAPVATTEVVGEAVRVTVADAEARLARAAEAQREELRAALTVTSPRPPAPRLPRRKPGWPRRRRPSAPHSTQRSPKGSARPVSKRPPWSTVFS